MSHTLTYMIIDDEPSSHKIIETLLRSNENMTLLKNCYNGSEALKILNQIKCDLIFLDINMPDMTGFEVLEHLEDPPMSILITATFETHAQEAHNYYFEHGGIAFLPKPISKQKLDSVIERAFDLWRAKHVAANTSIAMEEAAKIKIYAYQKNNYKRIKKEINVNEIKYINKIGNYSYIYTDNHEMYDIHDTLDNIMEDLPENLFMRISKGVIIMLTKVTSHKDETVILGKDANGDPIIQDVAKYNIDTLNKRLREFFIR